MTIKEFMRRTQEYAYSEYKIDLQLDVEKDHKYSRLFAVKDGSGGTGEWYSARIVDATIGGKKTKLVEIRKDNDIFWVSRPCDLASILCG